MVDLSVDSLPQLVIRRADELGDAPWLVLPSNPVTGDAVRSSLSFRGLLRGACAYAGTLERQRISASDRVVIILPNGEAFCEAFFGALLAGMVAVPLSTPLFHANQQAYLQRLGDLLSDGEPAVVVTSDKLR